MKVILDGVLVKHKINGGVRYTIVRGRKVFNNEYDAYDYCDRVERLTGTILTIR